MSSPEPMVREAMIAPGPKTVSQRADFEGAGRSALMGDCCSLSVPMRDYSLGILVQHCSCDAGDI